MRKKYAWYEYRGLPPSPESEPRSEQGERRERRERRERPETTVPRRGVAWRCLPGAEGLEGGWLDVIASDIH